LRITRTFSVEFNWNIVRFSLLSFLVISLRLESNQQLLVDFLPEV